MVSCSKTMKMESIVGTWVEQYDPTVFAMDGLIEFTFEAGNRYRLFTYDALSGETRTDQSGTYTIDPKNKTITLTPQGGIVAFVNDGPDVTYHVVKLTADEMVWQREGTTYSIGTWGSDYRHFVRERIRWYD